MPYSYQFSESISIEWLVKNLPQFLFPDLSKQQTRIEKPFIGIISTKDRQPVGLILANAESTGIIYRIHSFLVNPEFQNQRIGFSLLKKLEKEILKRGGGIIEGSYKSHWKSVDYIQKILLDQNWETPEPQLLFAKGEVNIAKDFFTSSASINHPFLLIPFTHLKKTDLEFVQNKNKQIGWFDPGFDPFYEWQTINRKCSFILKKEKTIIGWIVSHRINSDLNELTALFIDSNYRQFKIAYLMIQKVFETQLELGISQFMVTSKMDGNAIAKLLRKEAEKREIFCTTSFYARKVL